MATIQVHVPEAYALDAKGNQLDRLVIKHACTQADMEPQLSAFVAKWSQESPYQPCRWLCGLPVTPQGMW